MIALVAIFNTRIAGIVNYDAKKKKLQNPPSIDRESFKANIQYLIQSNVVAIAILANCRSLTYYSLFPSASNLTAFPVLSVR